jgi:hypothetical protein
MLIGAALDGRIPPASEKRAIARMRGPPARLDTIGPADVASLRATRRIARTQLRDAARALSGCRRLAVSRRAWRDCVRWPLSHAAIGGRASAGVLYAVTASTGPSVCRERAMGEASGLRLVAGQADELVRGLANRSPLARSQRPAAFAATKRLIGDVLRQLSNALPPCLPQPLER